MVEQGILRDVQCHIVAAGEVIHRHGRDAHHQHTVEHGLEEFEDAAVEALAMCQGMIDRLTLHVKHVVCEIIILIYNQVKRMLTFLGFEINLVEFVAIETLGLDIGCEAVVVEVLISFGKVIQHDVAESAETLLQRVNGAKHEGKVQRQHLERAL